VGRIKGSDYATVYLGALQAVLQQSIAFVLSEQKAEKEVDLLTSQNLEVIAGTARENNKSTSQIALADQQRLSEVQNTRLIDANADAKEYEVSQLLPEQKIKIQEEVDLLQSQDLEIIAGTSRQNNAVTEQIAASKANTAIKQAQNTAQVALINRQKDGFDEKYKQDVFSILMGLRTTGLTQDHPGLNNDGGLPGTSANALANALITDAGIAGVANVIANVT
jgi:hypothetical protein